VYSVCGLIVPQEDLPFNDLGICPDVVSNLTFFTVISLFQFASDVLLMMMTMPVQAPELLELALSDYWMDAVKAETT